MNKLRTNYVWKIDVVFSAGEYFSFRYRVQNTNGWSGYSPISYIQAAAVPSAPDAPSFSQVSDTNVTLTILASQNDNGTPIDAYYL